jgi:acyl-CoA thioester hydrolase
MTTTQDARVSITVHLPGRLDEIDYLGIVHASNYLKYMEHARIKLLEQQGVDLLAWVKKGIRGVVAKDTINYRHPSKYGDVLAITCRVEEIKKCSAELGYDIVEQSTGKEIIRATTTVVTIDPSGRPTPIPEEVREALSRPV